MLIKKTIIGLLGLLLIIGFFLPWIDIGIFNLVPYKIANMVVENNELNGSNLKPMLISCFFPICGLIIIFFEIFDKKGQVTKFTSFLPIGGIGFAFIYLQSELRFNFSMKEIVDQSFSNNYSSKIDNLFEYMEVGFVLTIVSSVLLPIIAFKSIDPINQAQPQIGSKNNEIATFVNKVVLFITEIIHTSIKEFRKVFINKNSANNRIVSLEVQNSNLQKRYCIQCGTANEVNSNYCLNCGTKIQ